MRVAPVYLLCATLAVAAKSEETANYFNRRLEPVEVTADQETVSYLLPRLTSKYRPNSQWSPVTDPRFYVLTEMDSANADNQEPPNEIRNKRAGLSSPSLSIVNSLDVLRNRLLLEIARKNALDRNRQLLSSLGKRAYPSKRTQSRFNNIII